LLRAAGIVPRACVARKWQCRFDLAETFLHCKPMATSAPLEDRAADLRLWRDQFTDATPIQQLRPRQRATCVGVVLKIRLDPGQRLAVTVEDGSGKLTALFTGRPNLPGLELGGGLRLTGTVAVEDGALQMRNPAWASVEEPYA
jgi:hypothetical protein